MIDYSKPGKTPPGTKHVAPKRPDRKTWLDFVAPGPAPVESARIDVDDVQQPVNERKNRRLAEAYRDRRRRKGQRAFTRSQIQREIRSDVVAAQMAVLQAGPDAPGNEHRYRNVLNSMTLKYGAQIERMMAADAHS